MLAVVEEPRLLTRVPHITCQALLIQYADDAYVRAHESTRTSVEWCVSVWITCTSCFFHSSHIPRSHGITEELVQNLFHRIESGRSTRLTSSHEQMHEPYTFISTKFFKSMPSGAVRFPSLFSVTLPLLAPVNANRIHIPRLSSAGNRSGEGAIYVNEYEANKRLHPQVASFLPHDGAASLRRHEQLDAFRTSTDAAIEQVWREGKSHLRKQQELIRTFGVEGAVRETLAPSRTSFRQDLRQRPLDKGILEEIYRGLHGRRVERQLKKGVSWEHWITKGDGTAPVYTTAQQSQQTFAFGGQIRQVATASHPQQFPVALRRGRATPSGKDFKKRYRHPAHVDRELLLPEVAFIGRTSSGKSSLVNAVVNAVVTPYGHLQGTTDSVRFYNVADKIMLVDCPGYGYYNPVGTPALDAECAIKAMRAYIRSGSRHSTKPPRNRGATSAATEKAAPPPRTDSGCPSPATETDGENADHVFTHVLTQPRNIKRVFLCVSSRGMQHTDLQYCRLLESCGVPFAVVLCKTDAAPIRFLARLADHTRCQLVQFSQCKELMLASALRLAGISQLQDLIASLAVTEDRMHGATADFNSIV